MLATLAPRRTIGDVQERLAYDWRVFPRLRFSPCLEGEKRSDMRFTEAKRGQSGARAAGSESRSRAV